MGNDLILVGRVAGVFGVRGEVRIASFTANPMSIVDYRDLKREDGQPALTLVAGRLAKGEVVARAEGVDDRNKAEALKGLKLYILRSDLPPPEEDEFYAADLIGLSVENLAGEALGKVKSVHDFGAGDLLEIQPQHGPTWWLPFTLAAVPEVHIAEGRIVADPPRDLPDADEREAEEQP